MNAVVTKFLFLHSDNEPEDDMKTLDTLGPLLLFRDSFLSQSSSAIFANYDVVIIDISKKEYKQWYASYRNSISSNPNIKVVFLHPPHTHIDDVSLIRKLKEDWKACSIIKEIPKSFSDKADLISKLIVIFI